MREEEQEEEEGSGRRKREKGQEETGKERERKEKTEIFTPFAILTPRSETSFKENRKGGEEQNIFRGRLNSVYILSG